MESDGREPVTTETHTAQVLTKVGAEWANDLGETFPAERLYRFTCSCGWQGAAWYSDATRAEHFYDAHLERCTTTPAPAALEALNALLAMEAERKGHDAGSAN